MRLPSPGGLGIMKIKCSQGVGCSQGLGCFGEQGGRHILLQNKPGTVTCVQEQGWERTHGRGVQRKGRSATACAEWRLEQGSFWVREGFPSSNHAGNGVGAQSISWDRGTPKSKLEG